MKKNFKNRILAMATATTMVITAFPVLTFAEGGGGTVALTTAVTAPKYTLGVPKTASVTLNPQFVGLTAAEYDTKGLTSPVLTFANLSNLPVAVNVSISPKVVAGTEIVATPGAVPQTKDITTKKVFAFVEFAKTVPVPASGIVYDPTVAATIPTFEAAGAFSTLKNVQEFADGVSNDFMVILSDATYSAGATPAATAYKAGGAAAFRLGGQVSAYGGWKATDITLNIMYDAQTILVPEETALVTTSGTKLTSLGKASADSLRTYAVTSGFEARQLNIATANTTGVEVDLIADSITGTDTTAKFYTAADCKTEVAATALVGTWVSAGKVKVAAPALGLKAPITVYVQFKDATNVLGVFPITVNPII